MVHYVSGSNIFGQWFCDDLIINEFRVTKSKCNSDNSWTRTKLLQINWAYNILKHEDNIYITGAWNGKENQLVKLPLPSDINCSENLIVAGNDYNLIYISENYNAIWVQDLKLEKKIKKVNINIEVPLEGANKKQKRGCDISKVVVVNDSCLYLTSLGNVYSGILPSYIDTRHCRGRVCDVLCGNEHYVLLTDTGSVYTWGNGRRLQLGHGDVSNLDLPTEVEALAGIKIIKISVGGWHSFALSESGDLYAWGWNDTGQLGIKHKGGSESYPVPTLVDLFDENGEDITVNVKDIACGSKHSIIVLEDNSVWTTGCNKYGQLGMSEQKHHLVSSFKKVYHCNDGCVVMCGPWTSVIVSKQEI